MNNHDIPKPVKPVNTAASADQEPRIMAPAPVPVQAFPIEEYNPVDLWGSFEPPILPVDLLPGIIGQYASVLGEHMGCDPAGLAMSAITVCGGAIPDSIKVRVKQHDHDWNESARIWTVLVGTPSSKKSPIIRDACRAIFKLDRDMFRGWQAEHLKWSNLSKDEKSEFPEPLQNRLRLGDTTVEAAQEVFKGTFNGLLTVSDELSGWFGAMEKYGGAKSSAADRAFWLQAFQGGEYPLNRVGRGSILLQNLSTSLLGGIQPDAIRRIAADSVDDGLLQRFFPIVLNTGTLGKDAPMPAVRVFYDHTVRQCAAAVAVTGLLSFTPEAQKVRRDLEQIHFQLSASEGVNPKLASHIGKLDGLFARLCVIWHVVEHCNGPIPEMITETTAERVATFMRLFLLPHAASFYSGILGLSDDHDRLRSIASYILAHGLSEVDNRTVQRGDKAMRKISNGEIQPLLQQLAALNWLAGVKDPVRPSSDPTWFVNPIVHTLYRERAANESKRREAEKVAMSKLYGR